MSEEKLPISEVIEVVQHETIYKTEKWWAAVVVGKQFGRKRLFLYLWTRDKDRSGWKRKQKFTISGFNDWTKIKTIVEKLLPLVTQ